MKPNLPQVIEFNHAYDVKLETIDGRTRVVARIKPSKYHTGYKSFHDLPFVYKDVTNNRMHWFAFQRSDNWTEQRERADYFWNEFVSYVRGHQKRRPGEALCYTKYLIPALFECRDNRPEATRFVEHMAEALVAHLRVGLDEGKSDAQLKADSGEVVA